MTDNVRYVDFRERWPVDFPAAAAGSGAEDLQRDGERGEADKAPAAGAQPGEARPLPQFIQREVDQLERAQRRIHHARVFLLLLAIAVLLTAFAYATRAMIALTDPYAPLAAGRAQVAAGGSVDGTPMNP